ncbi:dCTP deaminase [Alteribacillus bidgolensis]|uniref:dCTP deaminase, dUMP-forming n=1 Tax=Alteribacillus bidgolensis TaxID=930129 RepID=A0A1G8MK53_9BACI|nr:dCTP deaminase [Alteribacillus bidgolensis]SDI68339.1 dCTP deaminase [Alteribacillus bidgolensis]
MILSDQTIKTMIDQEELQIDPIKEHQIQPASVDIRLGTHFLKIDENAIESIALDEPAKYVEFESEEVIIPPHSFLLATTKEYIRLPDQVTAFVEGRSSIGRMGLFIQNAGWVDPGFEGEITLELYNANRLPIRLKAGRRIAQLVFAFMDKKAAVPYQGKYQGQRKAVGSQVYLDEETSEK